MIYMITFVVLVFLSEIASSNAMRKYDNGVLTNLRKVDAQIEDYATEVKYVIVPGIENAEGFSRKVHKISAFGEEFVDKQPRIIWYTALYGSVFTLIGEIV